MALDTSRWSGEGEFTHTLIERLSNIAEIELVRVEDAPASRSDADYNFISNEVYVHFGTRVRTTRAKLAGLIPVSKAVPEAAMTIRELEAALAAAPEVGPPDYSDEGMLQYLHAERVIPPYQTRGYKIVELVRIYSA
jgi:hypothetical protein